MEYIKRSIQNRFLKRMKANKVLVLLGARRTGKTTFVREMIKSSGQTVFFLTGEDVRAAAAFRERSVENYKGILGKKKMLVIDEAQKIPDIGQILKLIIDEVPGMTILATGSSVFDLSGKLGEPLTGRNIVYHLFPFSQAELSQQETHLQTVSRLEDRMLFGSYPELLQYPGNEEKVEYLSTLVNSYLLKDILAYEGVRNSGKMLNLLRLIAFQIGKEVSMDELGRQLGMSKNTVERYLDLLSKVFVLFKVQAFSRNLRKEISKGSKWYFYDNGVRNALIANFNPMYLRNDIGELWENYIISERVKYQMNSGMLCNNYFWRTYEQQEIDWIEERGGKLHAFEFKWKKKPVKEPSAWKTAYPGNTFQVIHSENYLKWIGGV